MTNDELGMFLQHINTMFRLMFQENDPRMEAWADKFENIDYKLACKMATLRYNSPIQNRYRSVSPGDVMEMYNEAVIKTGYREYNKACQYCNGTGMLAVAKYSIGVGFNDYAYRCFCSNGNRLNNGMEQFDKHSITDYEQVQTHPARFVDVYVYDGEQKTKNLITSEMIEPMRYKKYSSKAIEKFKHKTRENIEKARQDKRKKVYTG